MDSNKFDAALTAQHAHLNFSSKEPLVRFISDERQTHSPAIPEAAGIAIVVAPSTLTKDTKAPAIIYLSYNLPLDFMPPDVAKNADKSTFEQATIYFLTTGSANPRPSVKKLSVLATPENKKAGESNLRGHISVGLNQIGKLGKGGNFLYAFSGQLLSGPVRVDLEVD
jgi:hypothetical protein